MELRLEELEASSRGRRDRPPKAVAKTTKVAAFSRKRPARKPFPVSICLRERMVVPGPTVCACCGGDRLRKLGEDVTETL